MQAQPIPEEWTERVVSLLKTFDRTNVEWTARAVENWSAFGREEEAYELLIRVLDVHFVLGHQVVGMRDSRDGSYADTWAFLCPHPWDGPVPLYAKIGLHRSHLYISLFSLHVDDGSEKLQQAIKAYRKKHKS